MRDEDCTLPNGSNFEFWEDRTAYTKEYHVACEHPAASDSNPGTEGEPFSTIGRAAELLRPAEKVVVHSGTYRECVRPARAGSAADSMISYEVAPGNRACVRGSERWTPDFVPSEGWRRHGDDGSIRIWMADLPPEWFIGYNPFMVSNMPDEYTTFNIPFAGDETRSQQLRRGQVYANGVAIKQVLFFKELMDSDALFWIEDPGLRLHIRLPGDADPERFEFEVTAREQVFAPSVRGLDYIRVSGFTFEYCANGCPIPQRGLVSASRGNRWIIEDNVVHGANGLGIDIGNESWHAVNGVPREEAGRHIVRRNHIHDCGVCGLAGMFGVDGTLIEDNTIENIGHGRMERIWESGAIKLHRCDSVLIRRNVLAHTTHAPGIWLDWLISNCRITGNVFHDIRSISGAMYIEATRERNVVDRNVFWQIAKYDSATSLPFQAPAVNVNAGEKAVVAHNLFGRVQDCYAVLIHLTQKDRLVEGRVGLCRKHRVLNNVFVACPSQVLLSRAADNECDGNIYDASIPAPSMCVEYPEPEAMLDVHAWREYFGFDTRGAETEISARFDPDSLTVTIEVSGDLPEAVSVPELHSDRPEATAGPFAIAAGKHEYRLHAGTPALRGME